MLRQQLASLVGAGRFFLAGAAASAGVALHRVAATLRGDTARPVPSGRTQEPAGFMQTG